LSITAVFEPAVLFAAGLLAGILNSVAGGGTFITFPTLIWVGIPPISANATNTFASCSGYLSGVVGFREELKTHKKDLLKFIIISFVGGITGAWLLLQTPEQVFREVIPWLMLFATILFITGEKLNAVMRQVAAQYKYASLIGTVLAILLFLAVCIYGGFFNAGQGIICLSYLALVGYTNINAMNGIKLLSSACVALVAIALFIYHGTIAWSEGFIVLLGTLIGGYLAAKYSRRLPQNFIRSFVIFISVSVTLYFFYDVYK
jgi:uncharacterized protein